MLWKAVERARLHDSGGRVRVYAIALDARGRVVSEAGNSYSKTHVAQYRIANKCGFPEKCFVHAELAALIKARGRDVATLVVARVDKNGNVKDGEPCVCCKAYISLTEEVQGNKIQIISSKEA